MSKDQNKAPYGMTMAEKLQPGKIDGALSAVAYRFGVVVSRFK